MNKVELVKLALAKSKRSKDLCIHCELMDSMGYCCERKEWIKGVVSDCDKLCLPGWIDALIEIMEEQKCQKN